MQTGQDVEDFMAYLKTLNIEDQFDVYCIVQHMWTRTAQNHNHSLGSTEWWQEVIRSIEDVLPDGFIEQTKIMRGLVTSTQMSNKGNELVVDFLRH